MKRICVLTGSRAEYGLLKSTLLAVKQEEDLSLSLIISGMHLDTNRGFTANTVKEDGFDIEVQVAMSPESDTGFGMANAIGKGIVGVSNSLQKLSPDCLVVLGDRIEALSATIAAAYMNIPIAHIHGGDINGTIDDSARHAITKFSHLHFPATSSSAKRLLQMGEEEWRVTVVGAPVVDAITNYELYENETIRSILGLESKQNINLVVQHSVTSEFDDAEEQMTETMEAIIDLGYESVVIYPNSDAGGEKMIDVIERYRTCPFIKICESLDQLTYLSVMKMSSVIVGNSSSGIIEAPLFGLPTVNIGRRQSGRERGQNVIDVRHNRSDIKQAIRRSHFDLQFISNVKESNSPYGGGTAGKMIAEILSETEFDNNLLCKMMTY